MAESKYNEIIAEFDNRLSIQDYSKAFQIYDLMHGVSSGREWKSSIFFFLSLIMLFVLLMENFNFSKVPAVAIVLLICMYMCTHYVYLLPKKAKLRGEHIYKSSRLLSKQKHFIIYRDCFVMKNQYEYLKRYYTEITDCIETDNCFLLFGGMEHKITVISKKQLSDEQPKLISEHFRRELTGRYRHTKSKIKRK